MASCWGPGPTCTGRPAPVEGDVYWVAADVGWLTFPIQAVVGGLSHGSTIACFEGALDTPGPSRFYDVCERHGVTQVLCAPTVLRMLRKFGDDLAAAHPLPRLRLITVQGEPLDGDTFTWARDTLDVPVVNAYGQTETGSTWTYPVAEVDDLKAGSTGTALPGHAYDVLDDEGRPVPARGEGQPRDDPPLPHPRAHGVGRPRPLPRHVLRALPPAATPRTTRPSSTPTATSGCSAAPTTSSTSPRTGSRRWRSRPWSAPTRGSSRAAVVGVPDDTKGTVPVAFVTLSEGSADGVADEVIRLVADTIGGIARPDRVVVTTAMPKTRTGKIMRRLMREVLLHGEARSDTSALEDPSSIDSLASAVGTSAR